MIVNPPAIYAQQQQQQKRAAQAMTFGQKLTWHLFYGEIAKRAADGRTYNYQDSNGEYISSFLSPYNQKILDNVEPEVRTLIALLINRGYLTTASCQGHEDQRTRFVQLAFPTEQSRTDFVQWVDSLNLPVYWYYNFVNAEDCPKQPETREGITLSINMRDCQYSTIAEQRAMGYTLQDLTDFWNIMFCRGEKCYWPLQMSICSQPGDVSRWQQFKIMCQWPLRNYYTKQLVKQLKHLRPMQD
jgi:hypothetical protein